jgi:hypothetical protein
MHIHKLVAGIHKSFWFLPAEVTGCACAFKRYNMTATRDSRLNCMVRAKVRLVVMKVGCVFWNAVSLLKV